MTTSAKGPKPASRHTRAHNAAATAPADDGDFLRARRGFIAALADTRISDAEGRKVHDIGEHDFLFGDDPAPDTVHPSLWRHARLNAHHGLFEVAEGVWQVRGYDISNVTFIEGREGWIVIDPLTNENTARAALGLVSEHIGRRPVTAVIYTHSHADHFGGILGVTTEEDVDAGRCRIIAPVGFLQETVGENVIAGPAMYRRAAYQFGPLLPASPTGHVDSGLGNSTPVGAPGLIAPTEDIVRTGQVLEVDGVRIEFQLTPETEAPAEMNFFFPDRGWLCMAENCSHTMHNLVPIRGALVRNALAWSKYIDESIRLFGARTETCFTSHNWPRWGNEDIIGFLTLQRDLYRWMHDQTMRLANKGLVPTEISEELRLPDEFLAHDHTRGYYGDLVHNSKAVYQRYLSYYDGNPANLHRLPPTEAGRRWVDLAGGPDVLLAAGRRAFEEGDYRWAAEVLNHLVFADPSHVPARELQADVLEQLGYQAESSTFRNAYLMGAQELRNGPPRPAGSPVRGRGLMMAMTVEQVFDTLAVRLVSENLGGVAVATDWVFTDTGERWTVGISNRTLFASPDSTHPAPAATLTLTRAALLAVLVQDTTFPDEIAAGRITIDGDGAALLHIFGNLDVFTGAFPIVEP